jgi:superfamily II DNA/RNA helicase
VHAGAIHGDLRQIARERALRDFIDGNHGVLVATDVAARGIHVDDVDVVVHFDPPEEHKGYVHRSGRTARAGNEGVVVTFVLWNQELDVERLQRRLGMREPIVEVFSNDPRLADLVTIDGPAPRRKPTPRGKVASAAS